MSVTGIITDPESLTMTMISDFRHDVEHVWQLLADPRQLERWWGPPSYPATVHAHDLTPGGAVHYTMTGPEGDTHGCYWRVELTTTAEGIRMTFLTAFPSMDAMQQLIDMGMEQGIRAAASQMDAILED